MIRTFRDRATRRLWMGASAKRFSGIEKQALRKLDMLHHARDLTICARLRGTGSKR